MVKSGSLRRCASWGWQLEHRAPQLLGPGQDLHPGGLRESQEQLLVLEHREVGEVQLVEDDDLFGGREHLLADARKGPLVELGAFLADQVQL